MSTAKKRTIKYTAFITLLILTVTYFSLLSPTSAYFYKTETKETTINFALFNVYEDGEQKVFDNKSVFKFKGATKLADFNELLFDDVAIKKEVTLINDGEVPARILTRITPTEESEQNGLRYFVFADEPDTVEPSKPEAQTDAETETETTTATETPSSVKVEKGDLKKKLEEDLTLTSGMSNEEAKSLLDEYNKENERKYVTIAPGESVKVTIVFWSEYDPVQSAADAEAGTSGAWQNAVNLAEIKYNCKIEIIASQDEDAAVSSIFETPVEEQ